jgi:gas vesicle protein
MTRDHKVGTILTFALGAGVGAVAALLLAPKTGEKLRGDIAAGISDGVDQFHNAGKDLKRNARQAATRVQDHVQDAMDAAQDAYSHAKKA